MLCPTAYSQCIASRPQLPPLSLPYTAPSDVANGLFLWEICLYLMSVPLLLMLVVVWCGVNITDLSPLSLRAHASNLDWTKIILIIGVGGQGFDWAAIIVCDDN